MSVIALIVLLVLIILGAQVLLALGVAAIGLVIALLPAALAGYLAGQIMSGGGYGAVANVLLGLGGGIVGNLLLSVVGVNVGDNLIENIAVGVVGAVVLVWLGRVVGRR